MVKENTMKQTEIGLLPEDWEVINLEKNFTLKARIGWQGLTTAEYLENGDYGLVTGTDFKNGYIDWDNCVFVEKIRFDQDKNIQLKDGDVLVTKDGTIGKIAYVNYLPKSTTLNSGVFVVRPKSKNIHNRFFYYVLMSFYFDEFLLRITAGSTITHLYQKDFVNFNFICPPLPEQEAIAEALSDADAWIESLVQLIAKKRLIKQGAMQELLLPKEDWEMKKFDTVFRKIPSKSYQINSNEYTDIGQFPIIDQGQLKVVGYSDRVDKVLKVDKNGVIIFGDHTRIIKFSYENFIVGADGVQLLTSLDCNNKFLYYKLLNFEIPNTGYNRHFKYLSDFSYHIPHLTEQTRIATILSDMDEELEALEAQLAKARQVKQGMMQELLTGRIRLM